MIQQSSESWDWLRELDSCTTNWFKAESCIRSRKFARSRDFYRTKSLKRRPITVLVEVKKTMKMLYLIATIAMLLSHLMPLHALEPVKVNHPGLTCDLGVGLWAWPMPMDWDGDGDLDLIVSCPDKPYNGIYFFENTRQRAKMPIFKAAVRIGNGIENPQVSYVDGNPQCSFPARSMWTFVGRDFRVRKRRTRPRFMWGRARARQSMETGRLRRRWRTRPRAWCRFLGRLWLGQRL